MSIERDKRFRRSSTSTVPVSGNIQLLGMCVSACAQRAYCRIREAISCVGVWPALVWLCRRHMDKIWAIREYNTSKEAENIV